MSSASKSTAGLVGFKANKDENYTQQANSYLKNNYVAVTQE